MSKREHVIYKGIKIRANPYNDDYMLFFNKAKYPCEAPFAGGLRRMKTIVKKAEELNRLDDFELAESCKG